MDFLTLAKKRYSVRAYTKQKVEKEKLDAILEAAHVAPTGGNCQPQSTGTTASNSAWPAASGDGDGLLHRQPYSSLYPASSPLQQQHPQLRLARQQTVLERLRQRMNFALENKIKQANQRQQRVSQRLSQQNPQPRIYRAQTRIQQLEYRTAENIRARLSAQRERFGNAVTHLEAVSPLSTLARGYSVTTATDGKVLKQTKQVKTGDVLTTRLSDGWVESEVKGVTTAKKTRKKKPD